MRSLRDRGILMKVGANQVEVRLRDWRRHGRTRVALHGPSMIALASGGGMAFPTARCAARDVFGKVQTGGKPISAALWRHVRHPSDAPPSSTQVIGWLAVTVNPTLSSRRALFCGPSRPRLIVVATAPSGTRSPCASKAARIDTRSARPRSLSDCMSAGGPTTRRVRDEGVP